MLDIFYWVFRVVANKLNFTTTAGHKRLKKIICIFSGYWRAMDGMGVADHERIAPLCAPIYFDGIGRHPPTAFSAELHSFRIHGVSCNYRLNGKLTYLIAVLKQKPLPAFEVTFRSGLREVSGPVFVLFWFRITDPSEWLAFALCYSVMAHRLQL